MKIIILKQTGIALPQEEGSEALEGNKLPLQIVDAEGNAIEAKAKICGRTFHKAISAGAIEEGKHPLIVECEHKQYTAAYITRNGSKVVVTGYDYRKIVEAAISAEKALGISRRFDKRLEALEKAYNGVDLTQLS